MALIGKWSKIEKVASETETQLVTVEYPSAEIMGEDHPDIDKAGTTQEVEYPVIERKETVHKSVYLVIHSINSWKHLFEDGTKTLFNICFRVYKTKKQRQSDYNSFIYEEHLSANSLDYTLEESEIQQAYNIIKLKDGFQELIND